MQPSVFPPASFEGHALLDSGAGEKLERFGEVVLRRPDPQALWRPRLSEQAWGAADLSFVRESDRGGRWEARPGASASLRRAEPSWSVAYGRAHFLIRPTPFKHVGVFPEQATNWVWAGSLAGQLEPGARLLNLFGYSGVGSLLAARAGYQVTHVDASKSSLAWLRENLAAADLQLTTDDLAEIAALDRHRRYIDGTFWERPGGPYTVAALWDE